MSGVALRRICTLIIYYLALAAVSTWLLMELVFALTAMT